MRIVEIVYEGFEDRECAFTFGQIEGCGFSACARGGPVLGSAFEIVIDLFDLLTDGLDVR